VIFVAFFQVIVYIYLWILDTFQDLLRSYENMIRTHESEESPQGLKLKDTRYHAFVFNEIIEMYKTHQLSLAKGKENYKQSQNWNHRSFWLKPNDQGLTSLGLIRLQV
jgi:hypothetical protein